MFSKPRKLKKSESKNVILFRQQANNLCPFKNVSIIKQSPGIQALPGFTPRTVNSLTKMVNQAKNIPVVLPSSPIKIRCESVKGCSWVMIRHTHILSEITA